MKKHFLIIIVCTCSVNVFSQYSASLKNIYSNSTCGLNYTTASVLLGKKMPVAGYPYYGIDQPATLSISGIPETAKINKAYIWWDLSGPDTIGQVIVQNTFLKTDTFRGALIGNGTAKCWGSGSAYRADVTTIISGNGNYTISGLPTDTTFKYNDVNGATLFIIYTDTSSSYAGTISINDGYVLVNNNTVTQTMTNLNVNATPSGKAFMIVSDLQNETGTAIKMNNGPYLGTIQNFWDYKEKATIYTPGQTTSSFGVQSPNDCSNFIMMGIYYQTPMIPLVTSITRYGNILTSGPALKYQWMFNGVPVQGAINRTYTATQTGEYSVIVGNNTNCYFASSSTWVELCKEKIKPNINNSANSNDTTFTLWTDSINYKLQWYLNGSPITNATDSFYIASVSGMYWLEAKDTLGCIANSDTLPVYMTKINEISSNPFQTELFPNPNSGDFSIKLTTQNEQPLELKVVNIAGQLFLYKKIKPFAGTVIQDIQLSELPKGLYFVRITNDKECTNQKLIVN